MRRALKASTADLLVQLDVFSAREVRQAVQVVVSRLQAGVNVSILISGVIGCGRRALGIAHRRGNDCKTKHRTRLRQLSQLTSQLDMAFQIGIAYQLAYQHRKQCILRKVKKTDRKQKSILRSKTRLLCHEISTIPT